MIKVRIPSRFQVRLEVSRELPGGYVDGKWVNGNKETRTVLASWQPIQSSEYRLLPEGESPLGVFTAWLNGTFQTGADGTQTPDRITKHGIEFKLLAIDDWHDGGYTAALFREVKP